MKSLFANLTNRLFTHSRRNRWRSERSTLYSAEIELLESRLLLTGNVRAAVLGGDLIIEGDSGDNEIALVVINGNLVVQGVNGTLINGAGSFTALLGSSSIPEDLRIQMGSGNDTLLIGPGIQVGDDLSIDTGSGNNLVNLDGVEIGDDLTIETGEGNDTVLLTDVSVGDDFRITTGAGQDVVNISDSEFGDNLWMETSSGNDIAVVVGSIIGDNVLVSAGSGDDTFGFAESTSGTPAETDSGTGQDQEVFFRFQIDFLSELNDAKALVGGLINPTAIDDSYTVFEEEASLSTNAANGVIANDLLSPVGDPITSASLVDGPDNGTLTLNPDGSFEYTPDSNFNGVDTFRYSIANVMGGSDQGSVEITVLPFLLILDLLSGNITVESNDTLITKNSTFVIKGETTPGAKVEVARDVDGLFNDGEADADALGFFSIDVTLIHLSTNRGANALQVRSTSAITGRQETVDVDVHLAIGTVVRFDSSQGTYDVELLDDDAPITVDNFIDYIETGRYENLIIHRSIFNFVIQGGGFTFDDSSLPEVSPVDTFTPIQNEFDLANSNLRGTLSMALVGGIINSGTSQWFINTVDNNSGPSSLDLAQHTVFGRVIGTGMNVVDQINALGTSNLVDTFGSDLGALTDVPLDGFIPVLRDLSGTVSIAENSNVVVGTGTSFTTEIQGPGSTIRIDGAEVRIVSINSDTLLTVDVPHPTGVTDVSATINEPPQENNYVIFSDISKILEP